MKPFHEYDIRGIYPSEINSSFAFKLGKAISKFLRKYQLGNKIIIGRDARISSPKLYDNLVHSCIINGLNVNCIGICTTPSLYYMSKFHDAAIMITASHNPKYYNGFKIVLHKNFPLSYENGLQEIEELINTDFEIIKRGKITHSNLQPYLNKVIKSFKNINFSDIKVIVDSGNGVGAVTYPVVFRELKIKYQPINIEIDGNFPNHDPDPSKKSNLKELKKQVIHQKADIGIAFDGDADRLVVIDDEGKILDSSIIAKILAKHYINLNEKFVVDLRLSKSVIEYIYGLKGNVERSRVGHVNIKKKMREINAIAGMEKSGHYMHRDLLNIDDGLFTSLIVISELKKQNIELSKLHKKLTKYHQISFNLNVKNKSSALTRIKEFFFTARMDFMDGISIEYSDWWANIRESNTENILRVSIEAEEEAIAKQKYHEIKRILQT